MSFECLVECDRNKGGVCFFAKQYGAPCERGAFETVVLRELSCFGDWRFREFASGALCAVLHGRAGRVEVWGGGHRSEVWFIEKSTRREEMLCKCWSVNDGSLVSSVAEGCKLAGVQLALFKEV